MRWIRICAKWRKARRVVEGSPCLLGRSILREEVGQVEVTAVGLNKSYPVDDAVIAKLADELGGQPVVNGLATVRKALVVFLGVIANWFNDIGVQIGILADQVPKILAHNFQITVGGKRGTHLAVANAENRLHIERCTGLAHTGYGVAQILG